VHRLALLRLISTRALIARAIADVIVAGALADADALFNEGEPPPEGDDLHGRIARAQWRRRDKAHQAEWEAAMRYDAEADKATREFFAARQAEQAE
jgi:hypothetical protein